ncbi:MAG: thiamine diphosphokinase [Bdellovibrionota bacterium]
MKALLVLDGNVPSREKILELESQSDVLIAADGAANALCNLHIEPDLVIGDFDSLDQKTRRTFSSAEFLHRSGQDDTDFEKALAHLKEMGARDVVVVGAVGKRMDHSLAHFFLSWRFVSSMRIRFYDDQTWNFLLPQGTWHFSVRPSTTMSLIPMAPMEVSLFGFEYNLEKKSTPLGYAGVSNVVRENPCTIVVGDPGGMAIFLSQDVQCLS